MPDRPALTIPWPEDGLTEDIVPPIRLMCDPIAPGFQTEKTRGATPLLCRDVPRLSYPSLTSAR